MVKENWRDWKYRRDIIFSFAFCWTAFVLIVFALIVFGWSDECASVCGYYGYNGAYLYLPNLRCGCAYVIYNHTESKTLVQIMGENMTQTCLMVKNAPIEFNISPK